VSFELFTYSDFRGRRFFVLPLKHDFSMPPRFTPSERGIKQPFAAMFF